MVELEYILERSVLENACQRDDILSNKCLDLDLLMPTRLRVGAVEILGLPDEAYEVHPARSRLPSGVWQLVPILMIAAYVQGAFRRLRENGKSYFLFLDPDLNLELHGDQVLVHFAHHRATAPYDDVCKVFCAFSESVRSDFLAICPKLQGHQTLGRWFREGVSDWGD